MGKYAAVLSILNLVMLVASTACLYLSSILINIYLLPYLELVNTHFTTVPYLILAIGFMLFILSMFGVVAAGLKSRAALIIYAVLMSIIVVIQLASIFVTMELRNEMERKVMFQTTSPEMHEEMRNYWNDESIQYKWDTLQRDFQCCGALNLRTGFQDWDRVNQDIRNTVRRRGVPNSCCLVESEGCGEHDTDIFTDQLAYEKIHIHGCLAIMKERLNRDVEPLLLTYIGSCVVLALLSIISLVLASAFVASINRKEKGQDGLGMYQVPMGNQAQGGSGML